MRIGRNSIRTGVWALALVLTLASCGKEKPTAPRSDEAIRLAIDPVIVEAGTGNLGPMTRAKVDGAFPLQARAGFGLSATGATLHPSFNNFYAINGGDTWRYWLDESAVGAYLSGFASWGTITLRGYHPYNSEVTDLSAVPFRLASPDESDPTLWVGTDATALNDHLVAEPASRDVTGVTTTQKLNLPFYHLMTAIEIYINRVEMGYNNKDEDSSPEIRLGSVTFELTYNTGNFAFGVAGTYNAQTPNIASPASNIALTETTTRLRIDYPSATNIEYETSRVNVPARLVIIMPELRRVYGVSNNNAKVNMTFAFVDQDGEPYLFDDFPGGKPTLKFDLDEISNSGTDDEGLLAGYSYAIQATIGTYVRFEAPTTGTPHINHTELTDADGVATIEI